jgi:hypothetical protein
VWFIVRITFLRAVIGPGAICSKGIKECDASVVESEVNCMPEQGCGCGLIHHLPQAGSCPDRYMQHMNLRPDNVVDRLSLVTIDEVSMPR